MKTLPESTLDISVMPSLSPFLTRSIVTSKQEQMEQATCLSVPAPGPTYADLSAWMQVTRRCRRGQGGSKQLIG